MTPEAFNLIKTEFPEEFQQMTLVQMPVQRYDMFRVKKRKGKNKKKRSTKELYGDVMAEILEWLDENCSAPYFPRFQEGQYNPPRKGTIYEHKKTTIVEFYFISPGDAMAFKLMFWES